MVMSVEQTVQAIGIKPASGVDSDMHKLQEIIQAKPHFTAYLREYLKKQGLPPSAVQHAQTVSLISAYVHPYYLKAWRNRVNPNWALIEEADVLAPTAAPDTTVDSSTPLNMEKLKEEFTPLMAKIATIAVQNELTKVKLDLSPDAKAQIKSLATDAARATIASLATPRVIEIHNHITGSVNIIGLQHERFPTLLRAVQAKDHRGFRLNIWLTGPTGSGKTTAAENVAKALELPFGTDGSLDADYKVLGFRDANGNVISTQFLDIYTNGGIYVADEIDNWLPSALLSLNAALANGFCTSPSGLVRRHPDACVIACANTWGLGATNEYVGRAKQDAASLDRFQPKIDWPIDEKLEEALAKTQDSVFGPAWREIVLEARRKVAAQGLRVIISPRATFSGIALLRSGFDVAEVIAMTIHAGLSVEQKSAIAIAINRASGPFAPTNAVVDIGANNVNKNLTANTPDWAEIAVAEASARYERRFYGSDRHQTASSVRGA